MPESPRMFVHWAPRWLYFVPLIEIVRCPKCRTYVGWRWRWEHKNRWGSALRDVRSHTCWDGSEWLGSSKGFVGMPFHPPASFLSFSGFSGISALGISSYRPVAEYLVDWEEELESEFAGPGSGYDDRLISAPVAMAIMGVTEGDLLKLVADGEMKIYGNGSRRKFRHGDVMLWAQG